MFQAVLGSQRIEQEVQRCRMYPASPPHPQPPPLSTTPTRIWVHLLTSQWSYKSSPQEQPVRGGSGSTPVVDLHKHITPRPQFTLAFTLGGVHSVSLDKCGMTCLHHYSTIPSSLTALKVLCAPPVYLSPTQPLASTDLFFTFSIVFPSPDCHIVGIIVCRLFILPSFT